MPLHAGPGAGARPGHHGYHHARLERDGGHPPDKGRRTRDQGARPVNAFRSGPGGGNAQGRRRWFPLEGLRLRRVDQGGRAGAAGKDLPDPGHCRPARRRLPGPPERPRAPDRIPADRPGERGAPVPGRGAKHQADRCHAQRQRKDCRHPPREHHEKARYRQHRRTRQVRRPGRLDVP